MADPDGQHGLAGALTTAVLPQPGRRPFRARKRGTTRSHTLKADGDHGEALARHQAERDPPGAGSVPGVFSGQQGQFADGGPGFQFGECLRPVGQRIGGGLAGAEHPGREVLPKSSALNLHMLMR